MNVAAVMEAVELLEVEQEDELPQAFKTIPVDDGSEFTRFSKAEQRDG